MKKLLFLLVAVVGFAINASADNCATYPEVMPNDNGISTFSENANSLLSESADTYEVTLFLIKKTGATWIVTKKSTKGQYDPDSKTLVFEGKKCRIQENDYYGVDGDKRSEYRYCAYASDGNQYYFNY